jgi:AraC-like DNA-binding protein
VLGLSACVVSRSKALYPLIYAYDLPLIIGIIIYMVRALRQYGRWLRDNYADLEHKEIWRSFIVLAIILLAFTINEFCDKAPVYEYAMLVVTATLTCYLLWRVETLSDLSIQKISGPEKTSQPKDLTSLLQRHCIDAQLYLQYDLNITQLAKAIGTNRFYLSQYFSTQGITYNTYINNLRINHFTRLYREAMAEGRSFTAQQLAGESGYHSYSTFRLAFKQRMGQSVREWMNEMPPNSQD